MLDDFSHHAAATRLRQASVDSHLSANARAQAVELAERLERSVRIVVLGPDGVGKSVLCDALLSRAEGKAPPNFTRVFVSVGSSTNAPEGCPDPRTITVDHDMLGHAQVIDVSTPVDEIEFERTVKNYLEIADIVIWCTQSFEPQESRIWRDVSDPLKDHSFLVLTKADVLAEQGCLQQRIDALQPIVNEEFHSFFPVTTMRLRKLHQTGAPVPDSDFAASGIKALVETVMSLVRSGQRADLDSTVLFLERQGLNPECCSVPEGELDYHSSTASGGIAEEKLACMAARDKLIERAYDLAELGFDEAEGDMTEVLELCGAISEDLTDEIRTLSGNHPEFEPWSDAFEHASDKIMLMTMENDARSAADAVTILLQLRRDLEQICIH